VYLLVVFIMYQTSKEEARDICRCVAAMDVAYGFFWHVVVSKDVPITSC